MERATAEQSRSQARVENHEFVISPCWNFNVISWACPLFWTFFLREVANRANTSRQHDPRGFDSARALAGEEGLYTGAPPHQGMVHNQHYNSADDSAASAAHGSAGQAC